MRGDSPPLRGVAAAVTLDPTLLVEKIFRGGLLEPVPVVPVRTIA